MRITRYLSVTLYLAAMLALSACGGGSSPSGAGSGGGTSGATTQNNPDNRTVFIRTGDTPSSGVYDSVHGMAFVSEPLLGLVDAISVPGGQIVARIPVPGVEALGISADNTKILASTNTQEVVWIDTSKLAISQRQILPVINDPVSGLEFWVSCSPQMANLIGTNMPIYAQNPYLLSNGKVLFEGFEMPSWAALVEWDPVAGTAVVRHDLPNGDVVAANPAGTEVLFAGSPAIYNSATDSVTDSRAFPPPNLAAANPTRDQFAMLNETGLTFVDGQFNLLGQATIDVLQNKYTGMVYSPDGTRLYLASVVSSKSLAIITTVDATNFSILGTAPGYSSGESPLFPSDIESPSQLTGRG